MTTYEDEIDLRPYILVLLYNWWKICLLALLFAIIAYFFFSTRPNVYGATATLLVTRARLQLSLADRFPTVSEPVDTRARTEALLNLAQNDELAVAAAKELQAQFPDEARDPEAIKKMVEVTTAGDAILVSATSDNPDFAAQAANVWADQMVKAINTAYSSEQPLSEIQSQLQVAQEEYAARQAELQAFLKTSQVDLLTGQVAEAQTLLDTLNQDRAGQIAYFARRKQNMDQLVVQAQALQEQLQSGSTSQVGSLGDAIAVLSARAQAFGLSASGSAPSTGFTDGAAVEGGSSAQTPPTDSATSQPGLALNVQLSDLVGLDATTRSYSQDLEQLITQAKAEKAKAEESLASLSREVIQGDNQAAVEAASARLQDLKAALEGEQARERELTSRRDLAWQAMQALSQKQSEIMNGSQANNQINLAFEALPPEEPVSSNILARAAVAGAAGAFLGALIVIAAQWWRSLNLNRSSGRPAPVPRPAGK